MLPSLVIGASAFGAGELILSKTEKTKQEKLKQTIDYFNQIIEDDEPDKAILNMLINKIYIYHDKSVKFDLKLDISKLG